MTRGSIREYSEALRGRYLRAGKKEKGRILDEFTQVTGYHRKGAIRVLGRGYQPQPGKRRGRPQRYGPGVGEGLKAAWEATDRLCSKRLHPFLPELIKVLRRRRPFSTTRPGSLLKSSIPIRTFADGQEETPGFLEWTWCPTVVRVPKASI